MIGQSVGSDASPLSCFLFRPRKSRERRRKCSHTNVSNASATRTSASLEQTAHVCFHERKRAHTRLSEKNRTQGHTRRNRVLPDGAAITTLGAFRTFTNIPGPGIRTASFAAFGSWPGVLPKNTESLRDSDALMRVAVPRRRGPAGLRDLFSFLPKLRLVRPVPDTSFSSPDAPACAVPVQAASQLVPFRLEADRGFSVLSLCLTSLNIFVQMLPSCT